MLQLPQRTLTLVLTGKTSKVTVENTVVIDVTSALHWFLLYHSVGCSKVQVDPNKTVRMSALEQQLVIQLLSDDEHKIRILKETGRFASKNGNIERLLKCLSLKQIDEILKNPLTFRRLVNEKPLTFTSTRWLEEGKPDLVTMGIVPNGF